MINPTKTNPLNQNIELGKIAWYRDYDQAFSRKYSPKINQFFFSFKKYQDALLVLILEET